MHTFDAPAVPAGWYPDPTGPARERYFDGATWTEQVRAVQARLAPRVTHPVAPVLPGTSYQAAAVMTAPRTAPASPPLPAAGAAFTPATSAFQADPDASGLLAPRRTARTSTPTEAHASVVPPAHAAQIDPMSSQALLHDLPVPKFLQEQFHDSPAGWYPDPARGGGLRFFDGVKWTARIRPMPQHVRRLPVPAKALAGGVLAVADANAVRRAHRPVRQAKLVVPAPQPLPHRRARTGSVLGVVATLLILAGVGGSGYLSWELWGSDAYTSYQQQQLTRELEQALEADPIIPADTPTQAPTPAPTTTPAVKPGKAKPTVAPSPEWTRPPAPAVRPPVPPMPPGDTRPVGRITIPKAGVNAVFVAGTEIKDLKKGPGLWLPGAFPGTPGNATISGHRNTYGSVFLHLDKLKRGDRITIEVPGQPRAVYEVRGTTIASPFAVQVTRQVEGVRLTLTTCDPVGTALHRMVVQAEMIEGGWADKAVAPNEWKVLK